jgi:hypothetical protein
MWERIEMFGEHWQQMEWCWHSKIGIVKSASARAAREMRRCGETKAKRRGSDRECATDAFTLVAKPRLEGEWEVTAIWDARFRSARATCPGAARANKKRISLYLLALVISTHSG